MKDIIYEDLKIKLEGLGFKVEWVLDEDCYDEGIYYLNINGIDVFEGAYQKWDTCIEEEGYLEKSFMNDEDLINYLNK
jgi:hypothetical protein